MIREFYAKWGGRVFRFTSYPMAVLGMVCLGVVIVIGFFGRFFIPYDPFAIAGSSFEPPNPSHLMGTDQLGRDVFAGVIHGIRVSLYMGIAAVAIAFIVGILLGSISGYLGGMIDEVLMRAIEVFQIMPSFVLAVVVITFFSPSLNNVIFTIALLGWPSTARLVRAQFLSYKEREFVVYAKALGVSELSIIFSEILPNTLSPVVVNGAVQIAFAILTESGLSFLGLSDPSVMSLGRLLGNAQPFLIRASWMCIFPGIFLALIVLSVNLFADVLNLVMNPRLATK